MTKRQLIDEILCLNHTAQPDFLARFDDGELTEYLDHLQTARIPRLSGSAGRYERYFRKVPTIPTQQTATETATMTVAAVADGDQYQPHDESASMDPTPWAPPADDTETVESVTTNPAPEIATPSFGEDAGYYAPVHADKTRAAIDDNTEDVSQQAPRPQAVTQTTPPPSASSSESVDQLEAQPWLF
jgi:hypothetical protein